MTSSVPRRRAGQPRGARFTFVQATCDEATLRARLQARAKGPSESDADLQVLERTRAAFEPPDEISSEELFTADARAT